MSQSYFIFLTLHAQRAMAQLLIKIIYRLKWNISKIFNRNNEDQEKVGGMNDYMTLVRVYFQAVLASRLGITNLSMLPDLRTYKQTFRVPTVNNKLGVGEKNSVKKTMKNLYGTSDLFFDEIDNSIKKTMQKGARCTKLSLSIPSLYTRFNDVNRQLNEI